jgi:hypothetical protein
MRLHGTLLIVPVALLLNAVSCKHVPRSPVSKCMFHAADKRRHANLSQCLSETRVDATKKELSVSMVVSGSAGHIEEATAALTSMLYFRTCRLHIYMLTDDANLRLMMQRPPWNETGAHSLLKVSYITVPDHTENVTFGVSNTFHAKYSILKATMDRLIPGTVDRLVAADIDVLWVGDVCDIESEFDGWHQDAFIGVAPEESGWYLQPDKVEGKFAISAEHPYKIDGVDGLNGGMIYYKLAKARAANWTGAWTDYIRGLQHPNPLPLGDQDVVNRFGTIAPQFIHILPNTWNHQLIHGNKCGTSVWHGLRVLHGNAGTTMTDTVTKHWWPLFAHADLGHHRGHTWKPHSSIDRCAARSFLACLSREGAICDGTGFDFVVGLAHGLIT